MEQRSCRMELSDAGKKKSKTFIFSKVMKQLMKLLKKDEIYAIFDS